jgi:hypothetical protein
LKQDIKDGKNEIETGAHKIPMANINNVCFSADETKLLVSVDSQLLYQGISPDYKSISKSSFQAVDFALDVDVVSPCPIDGSTVAVLLQDNELFSVDLNKGSKQPLASDVLNISWAPSQKELAISHSDGSITLRPLDGLSTRSIELPEELKEDEVLPLSIAWISESSLFVVFGEQLERSDDSEPSYDYKTFIIEIKDKINFRETYDAIPAFGSIWRRPAIYFSQIHNLSSSNPLLTFFASSTSAEVSALSTKEQLLPANDSERASLPINDDTGNDVNAIGLIVDVRLQEPVTEPCAGVSEANWLPTVWVLGHDGKVQAWYIFHVHDLKNGSFKQDGPVEYQDKLYELASGASTAQPSQQGFRSTTTTSSAFKPLKTDDSTSSSLFGTPKNDTTSAFGSLGFGNSPAPATELAFGSQTIGNSESSSLFGTPKAESKGGVFGLKNTESKPAFGSFGQTNAETKPAFGSTGFGTSESKPAFGSTSFGNVESKPAFGSSGFGNTESKPAFGSTSFGNTESKPAFGSSGFGNTESKPAFGSTSFGNTESKPAFGSSGFGNTESKPAFGSTSFGNTGSKSAFGSTSFGNTGSKSAFGSTSFGNTESKPAFGSTSFGNTGSKSAFGSTSFGNTESKPAFGSTSFGNTGSKSAFGSTSFGNTESKPAFGSTSFGNTESKPAFGSSGFGNTESKPVFGSTSFGNTESKPAFGSSGFGNTESKPAFGSTSFGNTESKPAFGSTSFGNTESKPAFGSSGFGSSGSDNAESKPIFGSSGSSVFGNTEPKPTLGSTGFGAFATSIGPADSPFSQMVSNKTSSPFGTKNDEKPAFNFKGDSQFESAAKNTTESPFANFNSSSFKEETKINKAGSRFDDTRESSESEEEEEEDHDISSSEEDEVEEEKPVFSKFNTFPRPSLTSKPGSASSPFQGPFGSTELGAQQTFTSENPFDLSNFSTKTKPPNLEERKIGSVEEHSEDDNNNEEAEESNIDEDDEVAMSEESSLEDYDESDTPDKSNIEEVNESTVPDGSFRGFDNDNEDVENEKSNSFEDINDTAEFGAHDTKDEDELSQAEDILQELERDLNINEKSEIEQREEKELNDVLEKGLVLADSESPDSFKNEKDESLFEEAKELNEDGTTKVEDGEPIRVCDRSAQHERAPHVNAATQKVSETANRPTQSCVESESIGIQTDPIQTTEVQEQAFENEEVYVGSFNLPQYIKPYVQLQNVKYPPLNADDISKELEMMIYDTEAELMVIEENYSNIHQFINDQLNPDVQHTEVSLGYSNQWRLSEAQALVKILNEKLQNLNKTKSELSSTSNAAGNVSSDIDEIQERCKSLADKVYGMEKIADPQVTASRQLQFKSAKVQMKVRDSYNVMTSRLRAAEQNLLSLKTTANVFHDSVPTPDTVRGIISHINTVTRDYAQEAKSLTEEIRTMNANHEKILEKLNSNKAQESNEDAYRERSLVKLKINDLSRKMHSYEAVIDALKGKTVEEVTNMF